MGRIFNGRRLKAFAKDESGTATVEAVIWLPVIFGLLVMIADVSMIFNGQARMLRVVQDANRALSVGKFSSATEVQDSIKDRVSDMDDDPYVNTTVDTTTGLIRTVLRIPASKLDIIGANAILGGIEVTVVGEHYVEY